MTIDAIMESDNPTTMLATVDGMANWSENKKDEFCQIFQKRAATAQVLVDLTAKKFCEAAKRRHFISDFHLNKLERKLSWNPLRGNNVDEYRAPDTGRPWDEIERIASERAKILLKELPPLKKAVEVIDADTSKMLARIDTLKKRAQSLVEEIEQLPTHIDMDDVDQSMTVRDFRAYVKEVFEKRKDLVEKLNKAGKEASTLEVSVEKRLYKGLPGLSDAVIEALEAHHDRSKTLAQMERRVTEQVKFGDSDAAMSVLSQFEKDEESVSDVLRTGLNKAMAALKASVKTKEKAKKAAALKE